ncbi:hypothetical protein A2U01_0052587 [Trifolium medium]|uniref:Uncharacterized protein n=1 Tax=Trifolium medium TaxID=97028 RepID=A0A392R765_9FABA|nr:hypothetical protein [Trifolium medium]
MTLMKIKKRSQDQHFSPSEKWLAVARNDLMSLPFSRRAKKVSLGEKSEIEFLAERKRVDSAKSS